MRCTSTIPSPLTPIPAYPAFSRTPSSATPQQLCGPLGKTLAHSLSLGTLLSRWGLQEHLHQKKPPSPEPRCPLGSGPWFLWLSNPSLG